VPDHDAVLITGVYGSGKSSVAEEIAYALEHQGQPYAMLDLDYLSWAGTGSGDRASEFRLLLENLAAVAGNYRRAGIGRFVLAYFARSAAEVDGVRKALGLPVRVARLEVDQSVIEQRLTADVASGRADDLRAAVAAIEAGEGLGVEDFVVRNDRPLTEVALEVMTRVGWA
jgi:adenylylsulfate kinase